MGCGAGCDLGSDLFYYISVSLCRTGVQPGGHRGDKLIDIQRNSDALNGNVMRVSQAVEDVVTANTAISESISNLSATSEEVAASTESSLALSDSSMNAMKEMNELLNEIYQISESMMKLSE